MRVYADGLLSIEELENAELRVADDEPAEKQSGKSKSKKVISLSFFFSRLAAKRQQICSFLFCFIRCFPNPFLRQRKSGSDKQSSARSRNPQESSALEDSAMEADEAGPMVLEEKPPRPKRIKKNVNRNLEPSPSSAPGSVAMNSAEHFSSPMIEYARGVDSAIAQEVIEQY